MDTAEDLDASLNRATNKGYFEASMPEFVVRVAIAILYQLEALVDILEKK